MLHPFGLHRLPAKPHQSRSTGHGNAWTRSDSTRADEAPAQKRTRTKRHGDSTSGRAAPEIKASSGTPEEPEPARRQQRKQDRQQTPSPTRAAEIEPEPESQKRGTVDHERRRRQREGKERKEERERRENDSKTLLFSPSHRTPSRSTTRASPAPAETPPFSVLLLWSMRNQRRSTPVLTIRKAGTVHIFTTSPTPKIWLCTLFSTPLSFSPNHHLTNTPFINDIFPYKYKYPLLQTSLRKNALINAYSSSSWQHAKIHFHIFMLRNTP